MNRLLSKDELLELMRLETAFMKALCESTYLDYFFEGIIILGQITEYFNGKRTIPFISFFEEKHCLKIGMFGTFDLFKPENSDVDDLTKESFFNLIEFTKKE